MTSRILVTTTSFLDTPGAHLELLKSSGHHVESARGPLSEAQLIDLLNKGPKFDAFLCGEDEFTKAVLEVAAPQAKVVSKYGVGLDRIDLPAAEALGIKVTNTPGSNHTTVSEHMFGLLLSLVRRIPEENAFVHNAEWKRLTGNELAGKTIGVFGFGRVGKEVAKRAMAFGMKVLIYNTSWSPAHQYAVDELSGVFSHPVFSEYQPSIERCSDPDDALARSHVISLHMSLTNGSRGFLNRRRISLCRKGAYVVNVSRGALVDQDALASALRGGHLAGYGADVLEPEPVTTQNPLLKLSNVILTPHIGSRTRESVERQGFAAVQNALKYL